MVFALNAGHVGTDILVTDPQVVTSTNHAIGGQLTIVVLAQSTPGRPINITVRKELTAPQYVTNA